MSEKTELRGLADTHLVRALDALAMAKGLDRTTYVNGVLLSHVKLCLHEQSIVQAALRGNPLLQECERNRDGNT